jgi:hypothetical protein
VFGSVGKNLFGAASFVAQIVMDFFLVMAVVRLKSIVTKKTAAFYLVMGLEAVAR